MLDQTGWWFAGGVCRGSARSWARLEAGGRWALQQQDAVGEGDVREPGDSCRSMKEAKGQVGNAESATQTDLLPALVRSRVPQNQARFSGQSLQTLRSAGDLQVGLEWACVNVLAPAVLTPIRWRRTSTWKQSGVSRVTMPLMDQRLGTARMIKPPGLTEEKSLGTTTEGSWRCSRTSQQMATS